MNAGAMIFFAVENDNCAGNMYGEANGGSDLGNMQAWLK